MKKTYYRKAVCMTNHEHNNQTNADQLTYLASRSPENESFSLSFWTQHPSQAQLVDLRIFYEGETARKRPGGKWLGRFTGRPQLILQLAPIIIETLTFCGRNSVSQYLHSLRAWWRIFDLADTTDEHLPNRVTKIEDITELHRRIALDCGMDKKVFACFYRILNGARIASGLQNLFWLPPDGVKPNRSLPPQSHIDSIRFRLKHDWFKVLFRWERREQLLAGDPPRDQEEQRLIKNYRKLSETTRRFETPVPSRDNFVHNRSYDSFNADGFSITDMFSGFYPDSKDIRVAFHLCLASTGWNPSVLLSLDARREFIEVNPKDSARYLMRGFKSRSQNEQYTEGLNKSRGSPGNIIRELLKWNEPLRNHIGHLLSKQKTQLAIAEHRKISQSVIDEMRKRLQDLENQVGSPWLYVSATSPDRIHCLTSRNYFRSTSVNRDNAGGFLEDLVTEINLTKPAEQKISAIKPGDFRDAYAAYAYRISGGAIAYVMKALGHKTVRSTQIYLDNTLLNEAGHTIFRTFSNALWREIEHSNKVDPTIIAMWSREGEVTDSHRQRLDEYRTLRISRIGLGCKNPTSPPKHIAPYFVEDGKSMCPVQRCTLCLENAVIFPESIDGLCKRMAELNSIKSKMAVSAFLSSSFLEEIQNTQAALKMFDVNTVTELLVFWADRIEIGEHAVIYFDGI
jgi:hypothetical protein